MAFDTQAKIIITGEAQGLEAAMNRAHQVVSQRSRDIEGVLGSARNALAALGVGLSAGAITAFAGNAIRSAAALDDMAEATGASVSGLSKLNDIARIGGGNLESVGKAIQVMNKALLNPNADENKGVGAALKAVNLNAEQLLRLDMDKRVEAVAVAFNKFADGAGKGNAAQAIFKQYAQEMVPFLNDVAENLDRTGSLTAKQAKDAEDMAKAWNRLSIEAANLGRSLVIDLAPGLTAVMRGFSRGGFLGGIGAAEGVARPLEEIEKAFKNARKPILDAGSVANASALDRWNYQYWESAVETARARAFEQNFVGPPSDMAGRPQVNFTAPGSGGASGRKAALSDLQQLERRMAKERLDLMDAEGEEAQRLWLEKFERERTLADYKKAQHLEEMAQQRELDEYYRTGGEEAAREYREADDKRRAEESYRATVKAAEDAQREWERTSQGITDSLTDALLRGFEGGADAAKNFANTLKNLFATLVLRPIIQPIAQAGAGLALGALGMGSANASGGGMGAGDLFGIGSAINSITGGAGIGGAVATGLEAMGATTGIATGWGAAIGTVAPYLAVAAIAYSMLKKPRGGPKTRGDAVGSWQSDYAALVEQLGGTPGSFSPYLQYEADPRGRASTSIYSGLAGGAGELLYQTIGRDVGRDEAALQAGLIEEYNRMLVTALRASDLPAVAREVFAAIDPATASAEQLARALEEATRAQAQFSETTKAWAGIARNLVSQRMAIASSPNLAPLSPESQLYATGAQFSDNFKRAVLMGDQGSFNTLGQTAQEYLQSARGYYASSPEYAAIYGRVQKWLEEATNAALQQADMADLVTETRTGNAANEAGLSALLTQLQSIDARLASIESTNALAAAA